MFIDKCIYFIFGRFYMPAKKQITHDMILEVSLKLLKEKGFEAITVKELSKALHCSTQPIYLSFTGMDELRNELIPLAVKEFRTVMEKESPDGAIRLYDRTYIHFAQNAPRLFCFLFMRANAFIQTKRLLFPIIDQSVKEFMALYGISYEEADSLHDHLWMHTHGIASMIATDFCDWNMEKAEHMLTECKEAFLKKYEK